MRCNLVPYSRFISRLEQVDDLTKESVASRPQMRQFETISTDFERVRPGVGAKSEQVGSYGRTAFKPVRIFASDFECCTASVSIDMLSLQQ
jgi:hypothetical protein